MQSRLFFTFQTIGYQKNKDDVCGFSRDSVSNPPLYLQNLTCQSNAWRPGCFVYPLSDDFAYTCGKSLSSICYKELKNCQHALCSSTIKWAIKGSCHDKKLFTSCMYLVKTSVVCQSVC